MLTNNTDVQCNPQVKSEIRYCADIGMFSIDRPRTSCKHASAFCVKHCYNAKLEKIFKLDGKDKRNEIYWNQISGLEVKRTLDRKRNQTKRVRFMTRGESFSTVSDVYRVKDILTSNKKRLFWLPTRAWRNPTIKALIEKEIFPLKNARVQASLDPSNTREEVYTAGLNNWSTMYFGDDSKTANRKKCPKTWEHKTGHCSICRNGCFSSKITHIHLKQH